MKALARLPGFNLRAKLILSYLAVALGAILILTMAIGIAAKNFIAVKQLTILHQHAEFWAQHVVYNYQSSGGKWNAMPPPGDPVLLAIIDASGHFSCTQPGYISSQNCSSPELKDALNKAAGGKTTNGTMPVTIKNQTFSTAYISTPLEWNDHIIGALFLAEPQSGLDDLLVTQVNEAILFTGLIVAIVVTALSLLLAHHFTRPLKSLIEATEQMKQGQYTQRVTPLRSQDELGRLALAFNEMAATIEADVEELHRQEQQRRELLANIAHDLATPLTAIQGFSEALADDIITDPTARLETAQRIGREVQRLRRLVADLQQMTSFESGRAPLDRAPLDMQSLVDETLTVVEPECAQMGISVHNEIPAATPAVLADSDRIAQVLLNLLDNARRHTPYGGRISVGARREGDSLHIWVSDTGSGIPSADLPHIFERFYRADRSRSGATGGSGLGLSIVKAIITAHGGKVWAESQPGDGTYITFTLPLVSVPTVTSQ
ncbi:HAMP domain-containing histidine kinase [Ktedonosporobacter rubrisoli]|uniref:histidine kinase n=1 Tax=Ktedonosporobacter rubrisoli TaxID=2509675 RepID=A0A4P6JXJ8_KTERU|nr:HAMP domain-containing sensor histidine kinase [Ktedonosporobacter rubrisoli]QBD80479.1 HAMP domain-containing histidine kinase [Ktedonosporobacter rubrisoli]